MIVSGVIADSLVFRHTSSLVRTTRKTSTEPLSGLPLGKELT